MSKPCIALVITDQETNAQIQHLGVGLLELRADLFKKLDPAYVLAQIKKRRTLKIPLLLTVRNQKKEGAVKVFSDQIKWGLIAAALPMVDMVDIELGSPLLAKTVALAHRLRKKVIVSSHDFQHMPANLEIIFKKSLSSGADMVKIAAKAVSWDDVMALIAFTHRHRKKRLITLGLGDKGSLSRLVLPAAGSLYTYAFLHRRMAPGQVDVKTLQSHLKFYGVVPE